MENNDERMLFARENFSTLITFTYLARTPNGAKVRGEMEARDENDLLEKLDALGLSVKRISQASDSVSITEKWLPRRLTLQDRVFLCRQLSLYFRMGMPLEEMFDSLRVSAGSTALKQLVWRVRCHVMQGNPLHEAFALCRSQLGDFFVTVSEIGEISGRMADVFAYAERHLQWLADSRRAMILEARWPFFTLMMCSGFVIWLLTYGLHFLIFNDVSLSLETYKKLQMFVSPVILEHWTTLVGVPLALYGLLKILRLSNVMRSFSDQVFLRLPIIGKILRSWDMLHFTHALKIMWQAGIKMEEALLMAARLMMNTQIKEALEDVAAQVRQGASLTSAIQHSDLGETDMVKAISIGEKTGIFEHSLDTLYEQYTRMFDDFRFRVIEILKYTLILISGVCVMGLAARVRGIAF